MIQDILDKARAGLTPSKAECIALLALDERSAEAAHLRALARDLTHSRFKSQAMLKAQIGIDTFRCPGKCAFCAFGDGVSEFQPRAMSLSEVVDLATSVTQSGELYLLFLMAMHEFNFPRLLKVVEAVRAAVPACTEVAINVGDLEPSQARELAAAGVGLAYHVCRLREGIDTALDPAGRIRSIRALIDAGIKWYTCCEPIGPEHSNEELADQLFLGIEHGCFVHATMRRVCVPGTPLYARGQISEERLAHITSVVALASLAVPGLAAVSVHEPNLPSLLAGANALTAEFGGNPRDLEESTEHGRGWSLDRCKRILDEAGYRDLMLADGTSTPITFSHS